MPMLARWTSKCTRCGTDIKVGEGISWNRRSGNTGPKQVYHSPVCPVNETSMCNGNGDGCGNTVPNPGDKCADHSGIVSRSRYCPHGNLPTSNCSKCNRIGGSKFCDNNSCWQATNATKQYCAVHSSEQEIKDMPARLIEPSGDLSALQVLATAMLPYIDAKISGKVDAETVRTLVNDAIQDKLVTRIVIENRETGDVKELKGLQHKQFASVLKAVQTGINVYLYDNKLGGPGSGKSTMAHMIAEAMTLPFYHISLNVQSQPSLIMGFINANGVYMQTDFRKWYEFGGVFFFDEIDNVNGNFLTSLNTSLANGSCSFPDGMVKRHEHAYCIAAGNTSGSGASSMHNSRQVLDSASRERFAFISIEYDEKLERLAALAHNGDAAKWIDYVQATRKAVRELGVKMLVTPRASIYGAQLLTEFTPEQIADMVIFKGIDADTRSKVLSNVRLPQFDAKGKL